MKATLSVTLIAALFAVSPLAAQEQQSSSRQTLRAAIVREATLFAQSTPATPNPPAHQPRRTQHRAKLGAIVGAVAGAAVGMVILGAGCHGGGEGVCSPPGAVMWTGMFAGFGAAGGAVIGALTP